MSLNFEPCPFCNSNPMIHEGDLATCSCIRGMEEMYVDDWNDRPIEDALRAEVGRLRADVERLEAELAARKDANEKLAPVTNLGIRIYNSLKPSQIALLQRGECAEAITEYKERT